MSYLKKQSLMKCHTMRHLIRFLTVCQGTHLEVSGPHRVEKHHTAILTVLRLFFS